MIHARNTRCLSLRLVANSCPIVGPPSFKNMATCANRRTISHASHRSVTRPQTTQSSSHVDRSRVGASLALSATYNSPIDGCAAHMPHLTRDSCIARIALQECSPSTTRRPYVCPPLWGVNCTPVPQHWDLSSGDNQLDIDEEDGYILSANGEGLTCGAFVPCEPLTAVRRARPGRLRIKPWILHRRRISPTATTVSSLPSPLLSPPTDQSSQLNQSITSQPSSGYRFYDRLPPTLATPNTDFKNLFSSLRQHDALPLHAAKAAPPEVPSVSLPISPSLSPVASPTSSSSRQQRPVLYVQTSSPVGTSAPPSTPALPSPCPSASQFRPSGRLPKRPPLPVWSAEYYPRAVVV
jgi:hypothetical protein